MSDSGKGGWTFDKGFAVFCLVLAALFGYETYTLQETLTFEPIGTKVWPSVLVVALVIIGVAIYVDRTLDADDDPMKEDIPTGSASWVLVAGLLLSAPVLYYFGYWVAGAFLMGVVAVLKESRDHILRSVVAAVVAPGAIFLLFTRVLDQFLPVGVLFE